MRQRRSWLRTVGRVAVGGLGAAWVGSSGPARAEQAPTVGPVAVPGAAQARLPIPQPPELAARAWILIDANSGRVLAERNADQRVEPASITKLMTAYVVFDAMARGELAADTPVRISEKAWRMGGSKMFVEVGKEVRVDDLLDGLIIQSGNDAAVALAERIAGSEEAFAGLMNATAQHLGLANTQFRNASGWPAEGHYMSARDAALLLAAEIHHFPDQYARQQVKEYTWNGIKQINRNRLLWRDPSVDGGKTGHTEAAGYCLVASAKREDMRLVAAVMGTDSEEARAQATLSLLNYGFNFFETHRLRAAGAELGRIRVWQGAANEVTVVVSEDFHVTVPKGRLDEVSLSLEVPKSLRAPVAQGQPLGRVVARAGTELMGERTAVAAQEVPAGGFPKRLLDGVLQGVLER